MSLLEVQDIHTYYGDSYILQGVRLNVERGTLTGVLGRNGVGKTTLIRSIMGFNPPRQGKIIYQGQDISRLAPFRIVRMGIALVPQGRQIFPSLTTKENMVIAARCWERFLVVPGTSAHDVPRAEVPTPNAGGKTKRGRTTNAGFRSGSDGEGRSLAVG